VPVIVNQPDRESFLRCRRQWDLQARMRRNLQAAPADAPPDLGQALRAALAVYYFPGMWDWDRGVTIPLVLQGLERELSRQRERADPAGSDHDWEGPLAAGREILDQYFAWARKADRFSPVLIEADFDVQVPHPAVSGAGLTSRDGQPVRYHGRIDMLAVDEHDAYWIVRHSIVPAAWPPTHALVADAAAVTAAWAWEQFYPGMAIAGTIHNEMRLPSRGQPGTGAPAAAGQTETRGLRGLAGWLRDRRARPADTPPAAGEAGPLVRQHEPSGGGRSIPQHRRRYVTAREPADAPDVDEQAAGPFRRTLVRHSPQAIAGAGRRLAADAAAMIAAGREAAPNPSDANCRPCPFLPPCLAMRAGRDSEFLLRSGYQPRPPDMPEEGRLGGIAWGTGRGAAPFRGG
jgi:PD-(D/E)XK nuclease superfamily